jgi:hypothetical protein
MTPLEISLWFGFILFIMIPITILLAGAFLSYLKANYRKSIGAVLIVVAGVEMIYWLVIIRIFVWWAVIYLLTLVLGVVCVYYSVRAIKD